MPKLYSERVIPKINIVQGPIGAEAVERKSEANLGSARPDSPNIAPRVIAISGGLSSFLKVSFTFVKEQ